MIDFKRICDRCYRTLGDGENMVAIKLVDDLNQSLIIKGHKSCVDEAVDTMRQLYGEKENHNGE
jgi:hypothetical protein